MPKLKSHKGTAKRFKITATGKVRARRKNRGHILAKKTRKIKRQAGSLSVLNKTDGNLVKALLPYS
jgi:large subunit ribosomal protein L35